jgi:hypothetical protein
MLNNGFGRISANASCTLSMQSWTSVRRAAAVSALDSSDVGIMHTGRLRVSVFALAAAEYIAAVLCLVVWLVGLLLGFAVGR